MSNERLDDLTSKGLIIVNKGSGFTFACASCHTHISDHLLLPHCVDAVERAESRRQAYHEAAVAREVALRGVESLRINALAKTTNEINRANGWDVVKPEEWGSTHHKVPAILALIHSEVSEALEAFRKDDRANFDEELADVVIRVLDCAGGLGIDLETAILKKLEKNKTRGHRHGGKRV